MGSLSIFRSVFVVKLFLIVSILGTCLGAIDGPFLGDFLVG